MTWITQGVLYSTPFIFCDVILVAPICGETFCLFTCDPDSAVSSSVYSIMRVTVYRLVCRYSAKLIASFQLVKFMIMWW